MKDLTESQQALEIQRLNTIATEKRVAYQTLEKELLENYSVDEIISMPQYIRAKTELIKAVQDYNQYRTKVAATENNSIGSLLAAGIHQV